MSCGPFAEENSSWVCAVGKSRHDDVCRSQDNYSYPAGLNVRQTVNNLVSGLCRIRSGRNIKHYVDTVKTGILHVVSVDSIWDNGMNPEKK